MTVSMDGKVAVVTGSGTGIGRASALAFAAAGASVLVADINDDAGNETVALIEKDGGEAHYIHADVTQAPAVEAMVQRAIDRFGRLDYAHNNAGMSGTPAGVVDITEELWDATIALNLRSVWLCMKYEIPRMLEQGGGAIVNTSSGAGLIGFADLPAYVASKHGVVGVTKSAALEFAKRNIRVNAVCPGTIRTPMLEAYMAGDPAIEAAMNAVSPNGRLGRPEEIAAAVVWLCSDEASFVNGVPFPVDAGAVAQ